MAHCQSVSAFYPAMKLPIDTIIAPAKIAQYLLKWRREDDKSKFLAQAGYTIENWQQLAQDLRTQLLPLDATIGETTNFGTKYEIRGHLTGPNGVVLRVVTIWMRESDSGQTKFITLMPDKEKQA